MIRRAVFLFTGVKRTCLARRQVEVRRFVEGVVHEDIRHIFAALDRDQLEAEKMAVDARASQDFHGVPAVLLHRRSKGARALFVVQGLVLPVGKEDHL